MNAISQQETANVAPADRVPNRGPEGLAARVIAYHKSLIGQGLDAELVIDLVKGYQEALLNPDTGGTVFTHGL